VTSPLLRPQGRFRPSIPGVSDFWRAGTPAMGLLAVTARMAHGEASALWGISPGVAATDRPRAAARVSAVCSAVGRFAHVRVPGRSVASRLPPLGVVDLWWPGRFRAGPP
jgi:hypothetical protein